MKLFYLDRDDGSSFEVIADNVLAALKAYDLKPEQITKWSETELPYWKVKVNDSEDLLV